MIGSTELIVIIIFALFLFGPRELPELAKSLGAAIGEFKKAQRAAELGLTDFNTYTQKAKKENVEAKNAENENVENEKKV